MFIETLVLSIVIGFLRKGKLKNFGLIQFRWISLLFLSFALQFMVNYIGSAVLSYWGNIFHIGSYLLIFYFFWTNKKQLNLLLSIGVILNFLVIILNGGSMPVDTRHMSFSIIEKIQQSVTHTVLTSGTKLPWLADIIYIPWPTRQMLSLGDIFLSIGVFILVQKVMVQRLIEVDKP